MVLIHRSGVSSADLPFPKISWSNSLYFSSNRRICCCYSAVFIAVLEQHPDRVNAPARAHDSPILATEPPLDPRPHNCRHLGSRRSPHHGPAPPAPAKPSPTRRITRSSPGCLTPLAQQAHHQERAASTKPPPQLASSRRVLRLTRSLRPAPPHAHGPAANRACPQHFPSVRPIALLTPTTARAAAHHALPRALPTTRTPRPCSLPRHARNPRCASPATTPDRAHPRCRVQASLNRPPARINSIPGRLCAFFNFARPLLLGVLPPLLLLIQFFSQYTFGHRPVPLLVPPVVLPVRQKQLSFDSKF